MFSYQTTPTVPDLYSRMMIKSYNQRDTMEVLSGFQAFFARPQYTGGETLFTDDPKAIEIDIQYIDEKLAPLTYRGLGARPLGTYTKATNTPAWTTDVRRFPLIKQYADIDSVQLEARTFNENPYEMNDLKRKRLRKIALQHHTAHQTRALKTCEYLSSQSILTGLMPALLNTVDADYIYDFHRNAALTLAAGTPWNNAAAFPLADLDIMWTLIRRYGKTTMDMAVLGKESMGAFLGNPNVRSDADVRRYDNITRVSNTFPVPDRFRKFVESGMTAYGEVFTPAGHRIWLFTYDHEYQDDALDWFQYMPTDQVLGASSTARTDRYFGPPDGMPMIRQREEFYRQMFGVRPMNRPLPPGMRGGSDIMRPEWFHYDAYASIDYETVTARTQLAPIYAPINANGFCLLQDVFVAP